MGQNGAGEKRKNVFQEFLENDDKLRIFLNIGMTSTEIANYFDSVNENGDKTKFIQDMRNYIVSKERTVSKRDPDFLAREIGGERLGLKKPRQSTKVPLRLRSYDYGNIHFNNNASPYTRIILEAEGGGIVANRIKVIGIINELQPAEGWEIREKISPDIGNTNYDTIISKLAKGGFIVKDGGQKYSLGSTIKSAYSHETRRIWEDFRVWEFREKFYP